MHLHGSFLLLGAGASKDAGVPLADEFVDIIEAHLTGLPRPSNDAAVAEFCAVRAALEGCFGAKPGLEQIFECIDDALDGRFDPHPTGSPFRASRALERIHYEIKRVIQRQCVVHNPARVAWIVPLLSRLRAFAPYPIVSLNYDNVIEFGCSRGGLRLKERVLGEPTDRCDIELVKLHGSVTWAPAGRSSLTRTRQPSSAIVRRFGEIRSPILETPLVYPSRRKMPIYNPFIRNALRFQELLADRRYTTCIVVGYRFPDAHVRSWLAEAMKARPELRICLVSPHPEIEGEALDNLTRNLPAIAWTERLQLVQMKFAEAIADGGFEKALRSAKPFGPGVGYGDDSLRRGKPVSCYTGRTSGLGASRDGEALFVADPSSRRILKVDLRTNRCTRFTRPCKDPRGIAVTEDGRVLVVENALLRLGPIAVHGVGTVREFRADGRRGRAITHLRMRDLATAALKILRGNATETIWSDVSSVLRWPTDVVALDDGTIYVTEARALATMPAKNRTASKYAAELAFNLHGLDVASDGALVGVEEGVAQDTGWGRVLRFELAPHGIHDTRSAAVESQPRLMAIAFVRSIQKVVVTQSLTWPHGRVIVLDYPELDNARFIAGFDLPGKIEYIPRRELLAVATRTGIELVPVAELARATPLEARPVR